MMGMILVLGASQSVQVRWGFLALAKPLSRGILKVRVRMVSVPLPPIKLTCLESSGTYNSKG